MHTWAWSRVPFTLSPELPNPGTRGVSPSLPGATRCLLQPRAGEPASVLCFVLCFQGHSLRQHGPRGSPFLPQRGPVTQSVLRPCSAPQPNAPSTWTEAAPSPVFLCLSVRPPCARAGTSPHRACAPRSRRPCVFAAAGAKVTGSHPGVGAHCTCASIFCGSIIVIGERAFPPPALLQGSCSALPGSRCRRPRTRR